MRTLPVLLPAGILLASPTAALSATASHDPWKLKEARVDGIPVDSAYGKCEACHTMDTTEGDPGTSYISNTARTLQWIKLYRGGVPLVLADNLACTFCHSSILDNIWMEDALGEFTTTTVKHPMGRKIDGVTNTNNEWLSTIDSSTAVADELQCVSCHAASLVTYPYHEGRTTDPAPWTGSWDKTVNPDALQNVAAAGDGDKKHCVDTCHGNAVAGGNGPTRPLMGHYAYGSFNGTTIYDPSGDALQVAGSTCATCHDSHTSTKPGLLQDGLKRGAADSGRTAIDEANCVAVCHAPGAFNTHGHGGKVGINATTCAPCHVSSIRHRDQTDGASRRRLGYADAVLGNLTMDLDADGLDNDLDGVKDGADADEAAFAYSKTSNCKTCHINYAGHGAAGRAASCLDCHDMHGDDAAVNDNAAMIRSTILGEDTVFTATDRMNGDFFRTGAATGVCDNDACHSNIDGDLSATHLGGPIDDATNCASCHAISHKTTPNTDESFKVICADCHAPGGSGPTVVWPSGNAAGRNTSYGSHLGATSAEEGDAFLGAVGAGWTGQCNKCHSGHTGTIKVPAPPASWSDPSGRLSGTNMRTRLGLSYANEANVAIHLGGAAQGGATEAEFCWGCHDANGVSEWGYNTKSTPSGYPVVTFATADGNQESENYGWIYTSAGHTTKTSDWTLGYWMSAYDANISRRVASMHSASFDPAGQSSSVAANVNASGVVNRTSPTFEPKSQLRCSNCHDVHDTFGPGGKPYLRGGWVGDPYPPELPPRSTYTYTRAVDTSPGGGPTPRGLSLSRDKGGYFIDQNSNWPTKNGAMDTVAETAGLCELCHGANVDTMDFYTGAKLWLPATVNGHSNSCLGGTGANRRDLFTGSRYGCGMGMQACVGGLGGCDASYPQYACSPGWCVPSGCTSVVNSGWYWGSAGGNPVGTYAAGGGDFANWYGVGTIGGAEGAGSKAHAFSCSKCHSPHATGLPALLIQNCIDPSLGNYTIGGQSGLNLVANNCHRKTARTDGWHYLAPGQ